MRDVGRKFLGNNQRFYVTFITPEAKRMLELYRKTEEKKRPRTSEDYVFTDRYGKPLDFNGFRMLWNGTLEKLDLAEKKRKIHTLHFHTLRKFFRTQCEGAGIQRSFWDFWMGHKGGYLDESYFRAEQTKHVEEYRKAIPNLTVYQTSEATEDRKREFERMAKIMAEQMGLDKEKISIMIGRMRDEFIGEEMKKLVEEEKKENDNYNKNNGNGKRQRIVKEDELAKLLDEGWTVKTALPSGNIVIEF